MQKKYQYFYKRHSVKHITAFLSPENHIRLKQIAKDADKSTTRYVSRLLEAHISQMWQQRISERLRGQRIKPGPSK